MRTTHEYRGRHAVASRADLGTLTAAASVVDWWTIVVGPRDAVHLTVRPIRTLPGVYFYRLLGSLYNATGEPVPNVNAQRLRFGLRGDITSVREIARHLARNAADGRLPLNPASDLERKAWEASGEIAEAFVERFGSLETIEHEATR